GVHYYAMQFIDGVTLTELIRQLRGQQGKDPVAEPVATATYVAGEGSAVVTVRPDAVPKANPALKQSHLELQLRNRAATVRIGPEAHVPPSLVPVDAQILAVGVEE